MVAEPAAFSEIQKELAAFSLVQTLDVQLELDGERTHRGMTEKSFLHAFSDCFVLCLPCLLVHDLLYHIIPYIEMDFLGFDHLSAVSCQKYSP